MREKVKSVLLLGAVEHRHHLQLTETQIETPFSPLFSVSNKRSALITSFSESQEHSQQYSIQTYISTVSHSNPSFPPLI